MGIDGAAVDYGDRVPKASGTAISTPGIGYCTCMTAVAAGAALTPCKDSVGVFALGANGAIIGHTNAAA